MFNGLVQFSIKLNTRNKKKMETIPVQNQQKQIKCSRLNNRLKQIES